MSGGASAILKEWGPYILLGVGGIYVFKKLTDGIEAGAEAVNLKESKEQTAASQKYLEALPVVTSRLSYSLAEYKGMAAQMLNALGGAGTDPDAVMKILNKLRNNEDWKQLQKEFGTPKGIDLRSWFDEELVFGANYVNPIYPLRGVGYWYKQLHARLSEIGQRRYQIFAKNTIKGRNTVTLFDYTKLLSGLFVPGQEVGDLQYVGINYQGKALVVPTFDANKQKIYVNLWVVNYKGDNKPYGVLKSQSTQTLL